MFDLASINKINDIAADLIQKGLPQRLALDIFLKGKISNKPYIQITKDNEPLRNPSPNCKS